MRAPFSLVSQAQAILVLMMLYSAYLFIYNNCIASFKNEAKVNLNLFADSTAQSKLTHYLALRTILMDFELEVVKFLEEEHPVYQSVLPRLRNVSKELEKAIKDVHDFFVYNYDGAKSPHSHELQCFRNETWNKITQIDRLLNMTLELEGVRKRQLESIPKEQKIREIAVATQCGARFPHTLAIFPKVDGNNWNAQEINRIPMVQNDTYSDILALKKLVNMYKERPASCQIHFITTPEFDEIRKDMECDIYSNNATEWLNEVHAIYYKYQTELELFDYNIQRSIFRINRLNERLIQKELAIWKNEVVPLVYELRMMTKLGFERLFKIQRN